MTIFRPPSHSFFSHFLFCLAHFSLRFALTIFRSPFHSFFSHSPFCPAHFPLHFSLRFTLTIFRPPFRSFFTQFPFCPQHQPTHAGFDYLIICSVSYFHRNYRIMIELIDWATRSRDMIPLVQPCWF